VPSVHLTRRAAHDLRDIHARSVEAWGEARAHAYLTELYAVFAKVAAKPDLGHLRARRAAPFLMVPAGRHFVVYDCLDDRMVILTVLHQARDIERIIGDLAPGFLAEIVALRGT